MDMLIADLPIKGKEVLTISLHVAKVAKRQNAFLSGHQ